MCRAEPLRDEDGLIAQWFGVAIDIDERKRAEDHLRETLVKLARASRIATVAELSASIAHELNQPLTAVMANAQAALRWLSNSPPNFSEASEKVRVTNDQNLSLGQRTNCPFVPDAALPPRGIYLFAVLRSFSEGCPPPVFGPQY
jgi:signal transduction histidine kinase